MTDITYYLRKEALLSTSSSSPNMMKYVHALMDEEKEKEERYEEEEGDSIYIKVDILNCVDKKKLYRFYCFQFLYISLKVSEFI